MAKIAEWLKIDAERVFESLVNAQQKLDTNDGEQVLDMSSIRRIDTGTIIALEKLVSAAEHQKIKLVLRGLNIDIYRVLKLAHLADRLTCIN